MKLNKVIFPSIALATVLAGCDDQLMEWQESDPTVKPSEIPLQLAEQIALYKPIKEYVAEYRPGLNLSLGMGADMYLDDPAYKAVVDENFTGVTLGNAMKMGVLMKANGSVDFTTVDRILAALPAGMKLYGHNMLWHTQQQQTYLKSLIAPKLVQEQTGGADGIANILVGDDSDFEGGTKGKWGSWGNSSTSEVVAGAGVDGSYGLVLTNPTDGSDYYVAQLAYDTPLQAGKEYKIRFSAKSDSPAGSLQIAYQNSTDYSGVPNGAVNAVMKNLGLQGVDWIANPKIAIWTLMFIISWKYIGFAVILMIAGMQAIPEELYEAARVDGAGFWRQQWSITLPLLAPTIRMWAFMSIIGSLQLFDLVYIIWGQYVSSTAGTSTMATYMVREGRLANNYGYGSAVAVVIFIISLVIALTYQRFVLNRDLAGAVEKRERKQLERRMKKREREQMEHAEIENAIAPKNASMEVAVS